MQRMHKAILCLNVLQGCKLKTNGNGSGSMADLQTLPLSITDPSQFWFGLAVVQAGSDDDHTIQRFDALPLSTRYAVHLFIEGEILAARLEIDAARRTSRRIPTEVQCP